MRAYTKASVNAGGDVRGREGQNRTDRRIVNRKKEREREREQAASRQGNEREREKKREKMKTSPSV